MPEVLHLSMAAMAATISQGCCKDVDATQKTIHRAKRTTRAYAVRRVAVAVTIRIVLAAAAFGLHSVSGRWAEQRSLSDFKNEGTGN